MLAAALEIVIPVLVTVVLYYVLTHLPASWEAWLKNKKTMITGVSGTVLFGALSVLDQLQTLDLNKILPQDSAMRVGFYMSLLMIMLRLMTTAPVFKKE